MNKIIAVVGMCGSGKTVATDIFQKYGFKKVYFGEVTFDELKRLNLPVNEANERMVREKFRASGDKAIYAKLNLPKIEELHKTDNVVVIDDVIATGNSYLYLTEPYKLSAGSCSSVDPKKYFPFLVYSSTKNSILLTKAALT